MASIDQIDDSPIAFLMPGRAGSLGEATRGGSAEAASPVGGQVMASVQVVAQRDGGCTVALQAVPGEDILALYVEGGPVLYLHPATARDLLQDAAGATRGDRAPSTASSNTPSAFQRPTATLSAA